MHDNRLQQSAPWSAVQVVRIKVCSHFHVDRAHCELTFIFTWNNITVSSLRGLRYGTS